MKPWSTGLAFGLLPVLASAADPVAELRAYLAEPAGSRPSLVSRPFASEPLTRAQSEAAGALLKADWVARAKAERQGEWASRTIRLDGVTMRFEAREIGAAPESGRPLFISMHGGGGAPSEVNDQQWRNQVTLYSPPNSLYIAPRAPGNTWDLWHQGHVDGLLDRLIEDAVVFGNADPERVYLMGYSAGGDGVYQVGPRMADRFAAAAMMAGHPNESQPLGLRNLPFTIHMGAEDTAYDRHTAAKAWGEQLGALRRADPGGYEHAVTLHEGKGHWMDHRDAEAVPWMLRFTRVSMPDRVVWRQDDVTHGRFYWLAMPAGERVAGAVAAARWTKDNAIFIEDATTARTLTILLHDSMLDLDRDIRVTWAGIATTHRAARTIGALALSLDERPTAAVLFPARIGVDDPRSK